MPGKRQPTAEDMEKAEREVGKNIPRGAIGFDSGDVRDVQLDDETDEAPKE